MSRVITTTCIEEVSKILGQELTGGKISRMFEILGWNDADFSTDTKYKRIFGEVAKRCNEAQSAKPFFQVVEYVTKPQNYLSDSSAWNELLSQINTQLLFCGYEVTNAGKVVETLAPKNFTEAQSRVTSIRKHAITSKLHTEVLKYCKEELMQENYFHSLFEASKGVLDRVRTLSGLTSDGTALIEEAFKTKQPLILIRGNMLQSLTDKSQYNGLKSLLNTIVYLYRNPKAHEPKLYDDTSETDALHGLTIISTAHELLDKCINVRELDS